MSSDIGISHPELFRCSERFSYNRATFMAITIGQQLGSYEITALLGKGGMGEVYRARDTKLKRDVAIKILPDEFSRDADRVSRFQREAEVLASLFLQGQIIRIEQFSNYRRAELFALDARVLQRAAVFLIQHFDFLADHAPHAFRNL